VIEDKPRPRVDPGRDEEPPPLRASLLSRVYAGIVVWLAPVLVLVVAAGTYGAYEHLPSIASAPTATSDSLLPSHPQAVSVERESARLFGAPVSTPYVVVQRNANGLSPAVQEQSVRKAARVGQERGPAALRGLLAIPILNTLGIVPGAREHGTTIVTYLFFRHGPTEASYGQAQQYASYLGSRLDVVGITGAEPARVQQYDVLQSRLHWTEGATVALILLIVGLAFRAILAPLLTVLTAGLAFLISQHLLGWIETSFGLTMPSELTGVAVALMLGIVTDYSVFYLSGTRELLQAGVSRREAVRRATVINTPIVLTAGAVVSFGVASLLLGTLGFFRSFGPGMAVTVATGLVVSILLVPAVLRLLGPLVFWPGLRHHGPTESPPWRRRLARFATARPVAFLVIGAVLAVLALAASGLSGGLPLGLQLVAGLPSGNPVRIAAHQAGLGFAPGVIAPTELLIQEPNLAQHRGGLNQLELALGREPHVAGVLGPANQPTDKQFGLAFAPRANAARYALIFDSDATEAPAIAHLERIQRDLPALLRRYGLSNASVGWGGETALGVETVDAIDTSLWRVIAAAFAVNFLFLLIFLRSLLAPLYLLFASVAALAATFGLTILFFTRVLNASGLPYYMPVAFSVLLLSLGSDYNIFVVGRIWKEADRLPLREAVAVDAPRAGRAITIAGLALALSFAMLAIIPITPFAVMAFAMGVGILLDAVLVRTLLVPALIILFGRAGRWPRRTVSASAEPVAEAPARTL